MSTHSPPRSISGVRARRAFGSIASRRSEPADASTGSATGADRQAGRLRSTRLPPMRARQSGPRSNTTSESISTGTRCTGATIPRNGERVTFPEAGDPYEAARLKLAHAIEVAARSGQPERLTMPVLFDTPEADSILSAMQIFPGDNPWHEDISNRPVHPNSPAIIRSIGADTPLGYNLDMNFVLVPPDQPTMPVRVTMYPAESDQGPFPIPPNAPIENWPLARNEDRR